MYICPLVVSAHVVDLVRLALVHDEVYGTGNNIWHMKPRGVQNTLLELAKKTGLPCNPYTFRRTFASNVHHAGLDVEHIVRLGGWESLDIVLRYTRSVKFEDSLKLYKSITK